MCTLDTWSRFDRTPWIWCQLDRFLKCRIYNCKPSSYKQKLHILLICLFRAQRCAQFRLLDFWFSKGLSREDVLVFFRASDTQPKPQLGRYRRRRLRLGQIRTQRHFYFHQNRLRQANSLYMWSKTFNLYNPYKSSYDFIGAKFCVNYPNVLGAQQGIICAGLTGWVHGSLEFLNK